MGFKLINFLLLLLALFLMPIVSINNNGLTLLNLVYFQGFSCNSLLFLTILVLIIYSYLAIFFIKNKIVKITSFFTALASVILIFLSGYFLSIKTGISPEYFEYNTRFYFLFILLVCLTLYSTSFIFEKIDFKISDIVEIGIFVSLSMVLDLSFFKIRIGQNGGSISLALLPLMILALRKGFAKSFFASGIIFGLINCLTDGYGLFTYPFDYLLGFGSIALIGIFKNKVMDPKITYKYKYLYLTIGILLAVTSRLLSSTLSGMIFYSLSFVPSLLYQIPYVLPSMGICAAILFILLPVINKINKRFR